MFQSLNKKKYIKCLPHVNPDEREIGRGIKQDYLDEYDMHKVLTILDTIWFEVWE